MIDSRFLVSQSWANGTGRGAKYAIVPFALAAVGGVLAATLPEVDLIRVAYPIITATFAMAGVGVIVYFMRRGEALSLLPLITGFYLLTFVIGSVYFRFPRAEGGHGALMGFRGSYTPEALVAACALAGIAWGSLAVGYILSTAVGRSFARLPRPRDDGVNLVAVALGLLVLGVVARYYVVSHDLYFRYGVTASEVTVGRFSTFAQIASNLPVIAFGLVYIGRLRGGGHATLLWSLLLFEMAWALPSGERARIVTLVLVAVVCRYYGRPGTRMFRLVAILTAVCVLVVFPFGALYRGKGDISAYRTDPVERLAQTARAYGSESPWSLVQVGYEETVSRFSGVASLASIVTQGRHLYPIQARATLETWALAVVPRFVLPSKGNPSTVGNDFGRAYTLIDYRQLNTSSSNPTQVGDLYAAFGIIGITAGMLVIGVLARGLDSYFADRRSNAITLAVYATMLGQFLLGLESTVLNGFIQDFKEVIVYIAACGAMVLLLKSWARATGVREVRVDG